MILDESRKKSLKNKYIITIKILLINLDGKNRKKLYICTFLKKRKIIQ